MASFNPVAIFMFLGRTVVAIVFILLMMLIFFSLRVDLKNDDMARFQIELSDSFLGSQFTQQKSIFDPPRIDSLEKSSSNIALFAHNCEYEYTVEIESTGAKHACNNFITNDDCRDYCKQVLFTDDVDGKFDCNFEFFGTNFCECRKDNKWIPGYDWKFGYKPGVNEIRTLRAEFPAGIMMNGETVPATITIDAYDSLLTRLSCAAEKAFKTGENVSVAIEIKQLPGLQSGTVSFFGKNPTDDTNICIYAQGGVVPDVCRFMPDIPVKTLNLDEVNERLLRTEKGVITAYPLTTDANCPPLPDIIANQGPVQSVLMCMEVNG